MSKQIVMGVTEEELAAVGVNRRGNKWPFYLIEDMKILNCASSVAHMNLWESAGAENIGNDLSRLTKKKEGGYVELDVVVNDRGYMINGIGLLGDFDDHFCVHLADCPSIVGFGGILFEGEGGFCNVISIGGISACKPLTPLKARFWREG